MRQLLLAGLATIGLGFSVASAEAQTVFVNPSTGQPAVQYYAPYGYGSTAYYSPNTAYMYSTPYGGNYAYPYNGYTSNYVGPTVYGPGYTASYPYMYNQLNYGRSYPYGGYYSPGYTNYRTYRWGR
jgi:hypothetical protein